jgi:hypothetical protein
MERECLRVGRLFLFSPRNCLGRRWKAQYSVAAVAISKIEKSGQKGETWTAASYGMTLSSTAELYECNEQLGLGYSNSKHQASIMLQTKRASLVGASYECVRRREVP